MPSSRSRSLAPTTLRSDKINPYRSRKVSGAPTGLIISLDQQPQSQDHQRKHHPRSTHGRFRAYLACTRKWSDNGKSRDRRQLKHRAKGDVRVVPIPPPLTEILNSHLREFGTAPDGRLFRAQRGGLLGDKVYGDIWRAARIAALTPEEAASQLARRPYDLRHAAVSTWLNAGVDPTQVAAWAGHSVQVLLQVYAKCIVDRDEIARRRIEIALDAGLTQTSQPPPQIDPEADAAR